MKFLFVHILLLSFSLVSCQTAINIAVLHKPIVIELFTSEGCSSCPPAEELLTNISDKDTNILLLSYHVDYWNRLGWKDVFSKHEYSTRQYAYAYTFNLQSVYTPQAVVNGRFEAVGSNSKAIYKLLDKPSNYTSLIINPIIKVTYNKLSITWDADKVDKSYQIVALLIKNEASIQVNAGENEGQLLTHKNIVMDMKSLDAPNNNVIFDMIEPAKNLKVVLLAEKKGTMQIDDVAVFPL